MVAKGAVASAELSERWMKSHYESQPVEGLGMDDNISGKRVLTRTLNTQLIKMAAATKKCESTRAVPQREYIIRPRDRKERKHYTDDWALGDEEIEGRRSFRLEDKMETDRFPQCFVKEMQGADFNLAYLQRHGFNTPLLFRDKAGLGLRVPSPNFSVNDVRMCVGSRRILDVMDVNTQKNVEMTMKEWQRYYDDPKKDKLLNVISLEFSHTKLENYIQTPTVVRQIDWVDCVWPRHLKEAQTESTNVLDEMMYPKVQKYCLMSVKGCYTDFHVDFGGTSVWYHILKGSKIFWLIPPTERNLQLYEQWVLSGKQGDVFFGDTVDKCGRVTLTAGNTFFIPTGWIHAVYTPVDSLVFGGNFLHSFGIEKQLKTAQVEDTTHVPQKFRYPFFTEMLWYVLERYVHCLLGRSHLDEGAGVQNDTKFDPDKHIHLTPQELHGLKAIVMFLHSLPTNKKNVPELIRDPIALIKDVRTLVERHRNDNPEAAVTGKCILQRPDDSFKDRIPGRIPLARNSGNRASLGGPGPKHKLGRASWGGKGAGGQNSGPRRRRTRCKRCEACQRSDCGECTFCLDMVKFGGPGRAKQTCIMRQCLQPMLPVTAACVMCALDGWGQAPVLPIPKTNREAPSSLMECCICYEIIHPDCIAKTIPDTEGIVNEDLPNSWECPKCCKEGKNVEYRPRHFRARAKSSDIRRMSVSSDNSSMLDSKDNHMLQDGKVDMDGEMDGEGEDDYDEEQPMEKKARLDPMLDSVVVVKNEPLDEPDNSPSPPPAAPVIPVKENAALDGEGHQQERNNKREGGAETGGTSELPPSEGEPQDAGGGGGGGDGGGGGGRGSTSDGADQPPPSRSVPPPSPLSASSEPRKLALRTQLAHQLSANSTKQLRKPTHVVRPTPPAPHAVPATNPILDTNALVQVFRFLPVEDLGRCASVCRAWSRASIDPLLWRRTDLSRRHLSGALLAGIVRRQPEALHLDWTTPPPAKRHLAWLIARLPQLRELSLQGCSWAGASALRSCTCPPLSVLDLSFVLGLNDASLRELLSPPPDSRPGLVGSRSRLKGLRTLRLAGCDISDVALRYITQHLPKLVELDISQCVRVTDAGVAQLAAPPAATTSTLASLDLSSCRLLTDSSLDHLARCDALVRLDLRHTPNVTAAALAKFAVRSRHGLHVTDTKLIVKKRTPSPENTST